MAKKNLIFMLHDWFCCLSIKLKPIRSKEKLGCVEEKKSPPNDGDFLYKNYY